MSESLDPNRMVDLVMKGSGMKTGITSALILIFLAGTAWAGEKDDLNRIEKCWNDQAVLGNESNGVNNPYYGLAVQKGFECKARTQDFEKRYKKKVDCETDKYSAFECTD